MECRKDFDKPFSELCAISEEQKTFKSNIIWSIPTSDLWKYIEKVGWLCTSKYAEIESNWFYIGSSGISFYFRIHPTEYDIQFHSQPPVFKKGYSNDPAKLCIIFYRKFPDCAWIKGEIYTGFHSETDHTLAATFSTSAKDFDKKIDLKVSRGSFTIRSEYSCPDYDFFTIRCSMEICTKDLKCTFDKEISTCAEGRNYNSNKETINRHLYFDVKIGIDGRLFPTHKALLAQIPYFQERFDANESEQYFELSNIKPEIFSHILTFLYSGDIPKLHFRSACELYIVAADLKIHDLQCLCSSYLGANLNVKNVFMVLKFSNEYEDIALKKECLKFITKSDVEALAENSVIP